MKSVLKMKWVEGKNEWHVMTLDDKRLFELPDCGSIAKYFDNTLNKTKEKLYIISVSQLNQE